ncbi:MAG: hypothetical protein LBE01_00375, partial [Deltaproteobacteria bacterium]|nr:hypothetical protein [Deltaproteobacteria bacterium]
MPRQMIHSSDVLEYHVDTHDGVEMISRYYLFNQLIADELSEDRAQLLAEPVKNPDHNRINWYTTLSGQVTPYESLSPEDRRYAREVVAERQAELKDLAKKFLASPARNRKLAGELLSNILSHPEKYQVYMVGDRPVVAGWGLSRVGGPLPVWFDREAAVPISDRLTEKVGAMRASGPAPGSAAGPGAIVPPPVEKTDGHDRFALGGLFIGLLLGACLLAAAFLLFFPGFRLFLDNYFNPRQLDAVVFDRNDDEEGDLRRELDGLRRQYAEKLGSCPAPEPPRSRVEAPPPPDVPAEVPDPMLDVPPNVEEPKPKPEPKPEPKPKEKPKGSKLEIPEGAEKQNDVSFM